MGTLCLIDFAFFAYVLQHALYHAEGYWWRIAHERPSEAMASA